MLAERLRYCGRRSTSLKYYAQRVVDALAELDTSRWQHLSNSCRETLRACLEEYAEGRVQAKYPLRNSNLLRQGDAAKAKQSKANFGPAFEECPGLTGPVGGG